MAIYVTNNTTQGSQQNQSSSYKTALSITSPATVRRCWVYEFEVGADNVPNSTDCAISYNIQVQTATGTSTTTTPNPVDTGGGDAASLMLVTSNSTVEPSYAVATSSVFYLGLNQRASQKQIFRDQASSLITAPTSAKGFAFTAKSTNYASTIGWNVYYQE